MHRQILYLLFGAFLVVAPYSLSTLAFAGPAKYLRIGILIVMVLVGLSVLQQFKIAKVSLSLIAISLLNLAGALWSDAPGLAIFFKGMFFLCAFAGILAAYSLNDLDDVYRALRFISVVGSIAGLFLFIIYIRNPEQSLVMDRFAVGGINANLVGLTLATPLLCVLNQALLERNVIWKMGHIAGIILLGWALFATGSRGAVIMALTGSVFVILPFLRGRGVMNVVVLVLILIVVLQSSSMFFDSEQLGTEGTSRLTEGIEKNTRADVWSFALRRFSQSPAFGHGWLHYGKSSANFMNIYFQVLAEEGILGGAILLVCLIIIVSSMAKLFFSAKFDDLELSSYKGLTVGITAAILVHGLFESSVLFGTTTSTIFFGLSVGMADKLGNIAEFLPGPMDGPPPGHFQSAPTWER